ncbi:MAG: hypothetical protein ACOYMA_04540 [Bacteroidia bacterium]
MKKVNLACLFMLWLLLIFSNCKKEDEANSSSGEVKLQVTEYGSNAPVKKAFVGLLKRTSNGVGSSASWEVLQSAETDSNGFVNFGNYTNWSNLYIDVQHPDYYDISTISYDVVKSQQSKISLNGIAYLGLKFIPDKNKDPFRVINSDFKQITYYDTLTNYFSVVANNKKGYYFVVFKDLEGANTGKNKLYDSTIYLQSPKLLDTAYYTITY